MTILKGIVEELGTKKVNTKFGEKNTYSIKVTGNWVRCGFKDPGANVGDEVELDGVTGTYGIETKSVTILARGSGTLSSVGSSSTPAKSSYSSNARVFPIPALHGDRSIIRQNALARAVDLYIGARGGKPFELDSVTTSIAINMARNFEAYTAGDLDLAAATSEVNSETV